MRKEKEILKDFKKLGYKIIQNSYGSLTLKNYDCVIKISKYINFYECYWEDNEKTCNIDMKEHKLLHELFECWGWL